MKCDRHSHVTLGGDYHSYLFPTIQVCVFYTFTSIIRLVESAYPFSLLLLPLSNVRNLHIFLYSGNMDGAVNNPQHYQPLSHALNPPFATARPRSPYSTPAYDGQQHHHQPSAVGQSHHGVDQDESDDPSGRPEEEEEEEEEEEVEGAVVHHPTTTTTTTTANEADAQISCAPSLYLFELSFECLTFCVLVLRIRALQTPFPHVASLVGLKDRRTRSHGLT